jgi:hypothetical protein
MSLTGHTFKKKLWSGHGTPVEHTFWASSVIFLFFVFKNMRGNSTLTIGGGIKQPRYKQNPNKVLRHVSVLEFWIHSILGRTQTHTTRNPNTHNHSNPRTHWDNVHFSTISTGNGPTGGVSRCDTLFVLNYIYCFEKVSERISFFFRPRRLTSWSCEGGKI